MDTGEARRISARHDGSVCHMVITEFSYRGHKNSRKVDPLSPDRLEFRLRVFELSCAPSVLAQTDQDFEWIIIIDRDLSLAYRDRIRRCIAGRQRTHLHEFSPTEDMAGSLWLRRYASTNATGLLTTLLDDDDTLPRNFVAAIGSKIRASARTLPKLMTFGYKSSVQWELITSRGAPFGYKCSWHRGNWVRAAGVSMLCEFGDDLSVLALLHILADVWFWAERGEMLSARLRTHWGDVCPQEMHAFVDGEIQKFRARAQPLVEAALSWKAESAGDLFCELSTLTGPVVMTNHYFNDMAFRLLEHKAGRSQVLGLESFPNTAVKPEILQRELKVFRKQWRMYWQVLSQRGELSPFRERWFGAVRLAIWAGWRFVRI